MFVILARFETERMSADAAYTAIAAPAVRSVPAVAMRSSEKKRFRLNADAVFMFIRVEFAVERIEARRLQNCHNPNQAFF